MIDTMGETVSNEPLTEEQANEVLEATKAAVAAELGPLPEELESERVNREALDQLTAMIERQIAVDEAEWQERLIRSAAKRREERRIGYEQTQAFLAGLEKITDPTWLAILELHKRDPDDRTYPVCEGCDWGDYAEGAPSWPCRTVELAAERNGIPVPRQYSFDPADGDA